MSGIEQTPPGEKRQRKAGAGSEGVRMREVDRGREQKVGTRRAVFQERGKKETRAQTLREFALFPDCPRVTH